MRTWVKVAVAAAAVVVVGLLVLPLALARPSQSASTPAASATQSAKAAKTARASGCTTTQHVTRVWTTLPAQLRTDLTAVKDQPAGAARLQALDAVLAKARSGTYGKQYEAVATSLDARDWAAVPAALKTQLQAVLDAEPGRATLEATVTLVDKASGGSYGKAVTSLTDRFEKREAWTSCGR